MVQLLSITQTPAFGRLQTRDQFRLQAQEFSQFCATFGIKVLPYVDAELPLFSALDSDRQEQTLERFSVYCRVLSSGMSNGIHALDQPRMLWWAIRELGYRPSSDLFVYSGTGQIAEIYTADMHQIYRTLSFFEICSYSLEELFCLEWRDLFYREPAILESLSKDCLRVITASTPAVIPTSVGEHILREAQSTGCYAIKVNHKYLAPLIDAQQKTTAFVVFSDAQVMSENASVPDERPQA